MGTRWGLFCLIFLLAIAAPAGASTYMDVHDEAYGVLSRLEAEGIIRSGLLSTRPVSLSDAQRLLREAQQNSGERSGHIRELVRLLERLIMPGYAGGKTHGAAYARYVHSGSGSQALNYDNDGDIYGRGPNVRAGIDAGADDVGRLSFRVMPELRLSEGNRNVVYRKAYAVLDLGGDLIVGRDSQWWGPGYHGSLLLSNNAKPFAMARITNPEPVTLPWILAHLGPLRFTFFVTNLEKDRGDIPEPYFWGMRFDLKPSRSIEIGLSRTAMLGGRGRSEDLGIWLHSLTGRGSSDLGEAGNQQAGYDIKLTLPFLVQPVQLYMEAGAEDGYHDLPSQWAFIYGLYLPRIHSAEQWELRVEWAQTYDGNRASSWYGHHIYTDGYTYQDRVIGHHMGRNSRDTFTELTYRFPAELSGRISLFLDIEEHNISNPVREKKKEAGLRGVFSLSDRVELDALCAGARTRNPGNEPLDAVDTSTVQASMRYRF